MNFHNLHHQADPLVIGNVWDVPSSKTAEKIGFKALGTSSSAIATMWGYEDGENLSFSELRYVVERITANTQLPLSVDLESGYSRASQQIAQHIKELANLGVIGINIEDSVVDEERTLLEAEEFAKTLHSIKQTLLADGISIFLNVRTDTFLLGHPDLISETKKRIRLYEEAGADGIFVPCIEREDDIKAIVGATDLPVNVMCMPNLPDFERLKALGVKRISMGNFAFDKMYQNFEHVMDSIMRSQSLRPIFENVSYE